MRRENEDGGEEKRGWAGCHIGPEGGRREDGGLVAKTKTDPEAVARPRRRSLSVSHKLKVLDTVAALRERGSSAVFSLLVGVCLVCHPTRSHAAPSYDTTIARLLTLASEDSIAAHIQRLQDFGTRYALTDSCRAAEQYVYDYFRSLDLDSVAFDTVLYQGVALRNVIGTIRGSLDPGALVIICAHLDAISATPYICAPGAEDNGSGVSVVMESARILKQFGPAYTTRFIAFAGEEIGLVGSEHYASRLHETCPRIAALLNLDMVAWPGGAFGLKLLCDSATQYLAHIQRAAAELYTTLEPEVVVRTPLPSDNYPFQTRGYPCLANIERFEHDSAGYRWYHSCDDTIGNLSIPLGLEAAKLASATLMMLMELPAPPAGLRAHASASGGRTALTWTPNRESDIAAYRVFWGRGPRPYADSMTVGRVHSYTVVSDSAAYFAVKAIDSGGNVSWYSCEQPSQAQRVTSRSLERGRIGGEMSVRRFADAVQVNYRTARSGVVSLGVYDLAGQRIRELVHEWKPAGMHYVVWDQCNAYGRPCGHQMVLLVMDGARRSLCIWASE